MNRKNCITVLVATSMMAVAPLYAGDDMDDVDEHKERTAGQVIDDMSIAARAKAALAADPDTDAIKVDLEVDKDRVQINGFVDSEAERARVEEVVMSIEGVASVKNNLRIQPHDRTAGQYIDDKMLVGQVKAALADDPVAHSLKIDVEVDHGVVSLGGHVGTEAEKTAALNAASRVEGVVEVVDNLDVRS